MSGRRIPLEGSAKLLVLVSVLELSLSLLARQQEVRTELLGKVVEDKQTRSAGTRADPREHTEFKNQNIRRGAHFCR